MSLSVDEYTALYYKRPYFEQPPVPDNCVFIPNHKYLNGTYNKDDCKKLMLDQKEIIKQNKSLSNENENNEDEPKKPPNICKRCLTTGHFDYECKSPYSKCNSCGEPGHHMTACPRLRCFRCAQLGHWAVNCVFSKQK